MKIDYSKCKCLELERRSNTYYVTASAAAEEQLAEAEPIADAIVY
jgi:hypothetical protein